MIYNKQDAFVKIEEAYRKICKEFKIYEKVNIQDIDEGNPETDFKVAVNRKELDAKI